jgi:predicted metal-dependent phosphoesterase TrpH
MTKWLLADLHIHSTFSDGTLPIEEIITLYGEAGFDVIAITDHLFDNQSRISLELHEEAVDPIQGAESVIDAKI